MKKFKLKMKNIGILVTSFIMFESSAYADISVNDLELGGSLSNFQQMLKTQNFIFTNLTNKSISAKKLAFVNRDQDGRFIEYTDFVPSTDIKGELCSGKIYKITYKTVFSNNQHDLLLGRKEIYKYLNDNLASHLKNSLNQNENSVKIVETYIIDRNASSSVRGEEKITFALDESKVFTREGIPALSLELRMENDWFCPQE